MKLVEYYNEMPTTSDPIGYYVLLQKGHKRYLKIGTSERGTKRFNDKDYRKYSKIKPLYIFTADNKNDIYNFEDIGKSILRRVKGLNWHKNDRFTYFKLPSSLPININYGENFKITLDNSKVI